LTAICADHSKVAEKVLKDNIVRIQSDY
jgi:hypothetical protein